MDMGTKSRRGFAAIVAVLLLGAGFALAGMGPAQAALGDITTIAGGGGHVAPALKVAQSPASVALAGNTLYVVDRYSLLHNGVPPTGTYFGSVVRKIDLTSGTETRVVGNKVSQSVSSGDIRR